MSHILTYKPENIYKSYSYTYKNEIKEYKAITENNKIAVIKFRLKNKKFKRLTIIDKTLLRNIKHNFYN